MLTGGVEDVYNPLVFGLNPSLSHSVYLWKDRILTTSYIFCSVSFMQSKEAAISVTHSLLPASYTNISGNVSQRLEDSCGSNFQSNFIAMRIISRMIHLIIETCTKFHFLSGIPLTTQERLKTDNICCISTNLHHCLIAWNSPLSDRLLM